MRPAFSQLVQRFCPVALYSTLGHSHEVANLAIAQFQNTKQNQNALFLLWQSGKRIGNKLIVDMQITAVGYVKGRGDVGWIFPFPLI